MKLLLLLILMLNINIYCQDKVTNTENDAFVSPMSPLYEMKINDPFKLLNSSEKMVLCRLIVGVYINMIRDSQVDHILERKEPLYQLLKTNFPDISKREMEAGIFLRDITLYFNNQPEYTHIVNYLLMDGHLSKKHI